MSRKKRKGGTGLTEERNLVKLKGWVCCNGNASGEDLQIGYGTVSEAVRYGTGIEAIRNYRFLRHALD